MSASTCPRSESRLFHSGLGPRGRRGTFRASGRSLHPHSCGPGEGALGCKPVVGTSGNPRSAGHGGAAGAGVTAKRVYTTRFRARAMRGPGTAGR